MNGLKGIVILVTLLFAAPYAAQAVVGGIKSLGNATNQAFKKTDGKIEQSSEQKTQKKPSKKQKKRQAIQ